MKQFTLAILALFCFLLPISIGAALLFFLGLPSRNRGRLPGLALLVVLSDLFLWRHLFGFFADLFLVFPDLLFVDDFDDVCFV